MSDLIYRTEIDNALVIKCYNVVDSITRVDQVPAAQRFLQLAADKMKTKAGKEFAMRSMNSANTYLKAGRAVFDGNTYAYNRYQRS